MIRTGILFTKSTHSKTSFPFFFFNLFFPLLPPIELVKSPTENPERNDERR